MPCWTAGTPVAPILLSAVNLHHMLIQLYLDLLNLVFHTLPPPFFQLVLVFCYKLENLNPQCHSFPFALSPFGGSWSGTVSVNTGAVVLKIKGQTPQCVP